MNKILMTLLLSLVATTASAQDKKRPLPQFVPDMRGVPVENLDAALDDIGYRNDRTALVLMTLKNGRIESDRPTFRPLEQRPLLKNYREAKDYDCVLAAIPSMMPGSVTIATAGDCRPGSSKLYRKRGREYAALAAFTGAAGVGFTALGVAAGSESGYGGSLDGTLAAISLGLGVAGLAESGMFIGFSSGMFRTAKRIDRGTF